MNLNGLPGVENSSSSLSTNASSSIDVNVDVGKLLTTRRPGGMRFDSRNCLSRSFMYCSSSAILL